MATPEIKVHYVPKQYRPLQDSPGCSEEDDTVTVTSVGESFIYVIPSFDVLGVELRHAAVKGYARRTGEEQCYDLFIREDSSLLQEYPSAMTIKDVTIIKVN